MDATRPVALVVPAPPNVAAPFRPSSPPGKEGVDSMEAEPMLQPAKLNGDL